MKRITLLNVLIVFCTVTFGQSGALDPTFGINGVTRADLGSPVFQPSSARQTLEGNDKSLYILLDPMSEAWGTAVTKRLSNGSIDSTYGFKGYSVTLPIFNATETLQPDGKIVIAGSSAAQKFFNIIRLTINGNFDSTFGNNGMVASVVGINPAPTSLLVQNDGKIVVVGDASIGFDQFFAIARYNADGSADATFNGNGLLFPNFGFGNSTPGNTLFEDDVANAIVQQPDGKLLVAGLVGNFSSGEGNYALARYNTDGSIDSSFGVNGWQLGLAVSQRPVFLGLQNNSKIIVGTYIDNVDSSKLVATRYNNDGFIDSTFGTNGIETFNPHLGWLAINSMAIQSDGKIAMGGNSLNFTSETGTLPGNFVVVRFNNDGTPDNTFGNNSVVTTDFGNSRNVEYSIFVQDDDKIIASGNYTAPSNNQTLQLARYNPDGSLDNTFNSNGKLVGTFTQSVTRFYATAIQADGKVLAAGYTSTGTSNAFVLIRYKENGIPDSSFGLNGKQITDLTPGTSSTGNSMVIQPDGKIIVAGDNAGALEVVRYNTDGTLDASFNGSGHIIISTIPGAGYRSLVLQNDGKIVIGSTYHSPGGAIEFVVTRLNTDATLDITFNHSGTRTTDLGIAASESSTTIQSDGKILQVGIAYDFSQGNFRDFALIRYNTDGSIDSAFGTNGHTISSLGADSYEAYCVAIQNDGKIIVAGDNYANIESNFSLAVARYKANGQLDSSFNNDGFLLSPIIGGASSIVITNDGKIALGGTTNSEGGNGTQTSIGNFAVALLNPGGTPDLTFGDNAVKVIPSATGTGTEGRIQSMFISSNALFAAGFGSTPGNIGMIVKYTLTNSGPLPVSLLDFKATLNNSSVVLNWDIVTDKNLNNFIIERSGNGSNFSQIGAVHVNSISYSKQSYSTLDKTPLPGINFYRLKIITVDGSFSYSNVVAVKIDGNNVFSIFPNPVHSSLYVRAPGNNENALLQLVDQGGKLVKEVKTKLNGTTYFSLDLSGIPAGIYNLVLIKGESKETLRFIKE